MQIGGLEIVSNAGLGISEYYHLETLYKISVVISIFSSFILILISALSGGGITLGMAVFSGNYISRIFFPLYILLFLIALIYSSSNVIFALPCKKFLRTLFFVLWLISYAVLSYCLLFAWIFLGFSFSKIY